MNFWQQLPRPFWCLAPMEDVTDTVFRQIISGVGKPDVLFTEFIHVEAILHGARDRLKFTASERPLAAQIWGTDPERFLAAAQVIDQLHFDGIDINLGCPVRDVVNQGACSALIGRNSQVAEIIQAVKRGTSLPVSVKTRIGQKQIITEEWVGFLLTQDLAAITIHGRTATEMSQAPTHWDEIGKAVDIKNRLQSQTLIIGNGDVQNLDQAREYMATYGVDGVMLGRAAITNPAVFAQVELSKSQRLQLLADHIDLFANTWGNAKHFAILKKFVKGYVNGFTNAAAMREELMATYDLAGLKSKLKELMQ